MISLRRIHTYLLSSSDFSSLSFNHTYINMYSVVLLITDLYAERMRFEAIKCMSKSYRPTVPIRYAAQILGFVGIDEVYETNGADGLEEFKKWLKAHGAVLSVDNNGEVQIDTKVNLGPSSGTTLCL